MKRHYSKPAVKVVEGEPQQQLMSNSYMDIGGETGRFEVKRKRSEDWSDEDLLEENGLW